MVKEESGSEGDFKYDITGDKLTITGYSGIATDVVIPSKIKGHNVDEIGRRTFVQNDLISVTLPDGLKVIYYGVLKKKNKIASIVQNNRRGCVW